MEAANLGAYLRDKTDVEVEEALQLISIKGEEESYEHEYMNKTAPQRVIERFGAPTHMPR